MKICRIVIAIIIAGALLVSCSDKNEPQEEESPVTAPSPPVASTASPSPTDESGATETTPSADIPGAPEAISPEVTLPQGFAEELDGLWSRINGSTATIPLTAALYDFIQGGKSPPYHNTTPTAYSMLIYEENVDLIFVTYPSEYEFQMAKDKGVELEIIPIVKDALVFLVNAENPVDDVSLSQIRDVYTGKITDWSRLGGIAGEIIPYQRTPDSGSQTLFLKLVMDGLGPMDAPTEWVVESMGGLVESVSSYDNSKSAVGYSMFYYVNNMYGNSRFKLLGIDGVAPSRDSITQGQYALEDYYYAVIRKDTPSDSPARALIDWLLTDSGQTIAAMAGYIPLRPLDNVSPDSEIDPVYLGDTENSSGTGGTTPKAVTDDILATGGVRPPLSDLFYDGFNYIQYINAEIMARLDSVELDMWPQITYAERDLVRPFTGIPNTYPNYEFVDYETSRYLIISFPYGNPFFKDSANYYIRLTEDISPYGLGSTVYTVSYDYARRILPQVDLYTVRVDIPGKPDVSAKINRQIEAWTDTFPGAGDNVDMLNDFVEWMSRYDASVYAFQPSTGLWGDYLSVYYGLLSYGGPLFSLTPMIYSICFDINTGATVNLVDALPGDPDFGAAFASTLPEFDAIEGSGIPRQEYVPEGFSPAPGSVITDAWVVDGYINIYIAEPSGKVWQSSFPDMSEFGFSDLADVEFWFGSGVGAWSTIVRIAPDGTFTGYFHDSDMGDDGPGYPDGTRYECYFSGNFSSLRKSGDHEYSMVCESLITEGKLGEEKIIDGVKVITSTPYGFDNAGLFYLYLPGKRASELPEVYLLDWSHGNADSGTLACYGLFNAVDELGFIS